MKNGVNVRRKVYTLSAERKKVRERERGKLDCALGPTSSRFTTHYSTIPTIEK